MKPRTRRILYSLALLCWSAVLLYFHASGRVNAYLAGDFRPIMLAGGLGLAVMGLFNLLTSGHDSSCGHDNESSGIHPLGACFLMILPVSLSVAWTEDRYSAAALARKGLYEISGSPVSSFPRSSLPTLSKDEIEKRRWGATDGFIECNLMELSFASGDRNSQPLLDGLKVKTEGRWMAEKIRNPDGTRMRLYRLFMTCCAADARAIPIILEFNGPPPDFPENSWVKVSGTMKFPMEGGAFQPLLIVGQVAEAPAPQEENFTRK